MILSGLIVMVLTTTYISAYPGSVDWEAEDVIYHALGAVANMGSTGHSALAFSRKRRAPQNDRVTERANIEAGFRLYDADRNGLMSYNEFISAPFIEDSTATRNLFNLMDADRNEYLDVREFVNGLSRFRSITTSPRDKVKVLFQLLDVNSDNLVSANEYSQLIKGNAEYIGRHEEAASLFVLVADTDNDGYLNFDELFSILERSNVF